MNVPFLSRLQALTGLTPATITDAQRARAVATVKSLQVELPELLAVAVVDIGRGLALASHSNVRGLMPAKAAPYNARVVQQQRQALEALQLTGEKIEDILVTLRDQLHLLRLSNDGQQALYLVVSSRDTNLAIARAVLRTHSN